jgi:TolB-like protein/tetratricopeptide (TPR) repeat protein
MPDDAHWHTPVSPSIQLSRRLESWKAIAEYLHRHVTTIQRWEHDEGLPVHRHRHDKRGSIYAYTAELDAWLDARSTSLDTPVPAVAPLVTGPSPHADAPNAVWRFRVRAAMLALAIGLTIVAGVARGLWPVTGDDAASLAVLPLKNQSPDQLPDYFVEGLTDALTTELATLPRIRLVARQSVMQYRDTTKPASTIARELSVNALVEGAVQRSGQSVRIDIRLIDGRSNQTRWATTYERGVDEALALQKTISRDIVTGLQLALDPSPAEPQAHWRPSNPQASDAYLRARFFWNRRTHDDMQRAVEWYDRAIQLDPASPQLYAGLADVYATLGPPQMPVSEMITRGTAAAEKAIALAPSMGEPYAALGKLRSYGWDWRGAERSFLNAIERAPHYAPARYWYGSFLANQGRCHEARAQAHEAERLDPLSLPGNVVIAGVEIKCGDVARAMDRMTTILELDRTFGQAYDYLGRAYLVHGDTTRAIASLEQAMVFTGQRPTTEATLAGAYAKAGRVSEAESIASALADRHGKDKRLASAWSVALAHAGMRRDDAALTWLEHAYADREGWLEALGMDERLRHLRTHERFQRLARRVGLPQGN